MTSKSEVNTPAAETYAGTQLNEMQLYGESTGSIELQTLNLVSSRK